MIKLLESQKSPKRKNPFSNMHFIFPSAFFLFMRGFFLKNEDSKAMRHIFRNTVLFFLGGLGISSAFAKRDITTRSVEQMDS